ncbi:MAG: O-antigen ligase family protein [Coriobacteriia bacterium]
MEQRTANTERFSRALPAAWGLLGVLVAAALLLHELPVYPSALAVIALAATALCLLSARASMVLFVGCQAVDAYGFLMHEPFSVSVARIVVAAVVAGAVLRWLLAKPRPRLALRRSVTAWDLGTLIFLAGAAISVPFSYSLPLSLVGIAHVSLLIGAYIVVSRTALLDQGRNDIYSAVIVVGTLSALIALGQAYLPGFPVEVLRPTAGEADIVVRASAFFDNPNTMALLLVLTMLCAAERAWRATRPASRLANAAVVALSLGAIAMSLSRAALIGVVVGVIILGALLIRAPRSRAIAAIALGAALAAVLAIPGVGSRAASIIDFRSDASAMDRVYLAGTSLEMFADRPLTGVGIQAFRAAYPDYEDPRVTIDPVTDGHQMPASVPAEIGVLGLVAEVLLAGALVHLLVKSLRAGHDPLSPAGIAAMTAIAAMALFNTFIFFETFWIAAGLVGADYIMAHRRATDRRLGDTQRSEASAS